MSHQATCFGRTHSRSIGNHSHMSQKARCRGPKNLGAKSYYTWHEACYPHGQLQQHLTGLCFPCSRIPKNPSCKVVPRLQLQKLESQPPDISKKSKERLGRHGAYIKRSFNSNSDICTGQSIWTGACCLGVYITEFFGTDSTRKPLAGASCFH